MYYPPEKTFQNNVPKYHTGRHKKDFNLGLWKNRHNGRGWKQECSFRIDLKPIVCINSMIECEERMASTRVRFINDTGAVEGPKIWVG